MPPLAGGDAALAARLWVEASLSRPVRRQVVLGDARQLQRELSAARTTLAVEVEVVAPLTRVEMPRARALPHVGGVLRAQKN
jgi:hypothetical protein